MRTLDALGLKEWIKPSVIDLLDFAGVKHAFTRTPEILRELRDLSRPLGPEGPGPRVLVVSFRGGWLLHGTWEALIAEALRRRGARPAVFVCSGGFPETLPGKSPACGIASSHLNGPWSCEHCLNCALTLAGAFALPTLRLDDFVAPPRARALTQELDQVGVEDLRRLRHRSLPIGEYVLNSARWFLCVSELGSVPEGEAVLRAFAKSARVIAEAAPALLDRLDPAVVLLLNGLFFAERIIKAEAERRGIRVVTYERGFVPDTLCFSQDIAGYYGIDTLWERVRDVPLTPTQESRLDEYLADRRKGKQAPFNLWPTLTEDEEQILSTLELRSDRPTAVLFTNLTWDSAAQDRDRVFAGMFEWVAETVQIFAARPDAQLVVRVHPAEVRIPGWETRDRVTARLETVFPVLPPNVRVIRPESDISSYTLMNLSRCGLVYTSTAGLEMAMEGQPVVAAGLVHYGDKGFTLTPSSAGGYAPLVRQALGTPRDSTVRTLARRYGYALFFRYFHPLPLVAENPPDFVPTLRTRDPAVLDPGGDPTLDRVCKGILGEGDFFIEE
jgi:hypothetical protein